MSEVATFVRIFEPSPSDDFVTKRIQAAKDIAARYTKRGSTIEQLISLADNIAAAVEDVESIDTAFADDIAKLISQQSTSFVRGERPLDFSAMLLIGANQAFIGPRPANAFLTSADVLAGALWSALSYQAPSDKPKFEALRKAVLEKTRRWALDSAEASRRRIPIAEVTVKLPDNPDFAAVAGLIKSATQNALASLRDNATLDREEINMLWWALGDHSGLLDAPLSKQPEPVGAVVAGIELAVLLRRLPADAHRHLVTRHNKANKRYTIGDILEAIGANREQIVAAYNDNAALQGSPRVFPLMTALVDGESGDAEKRNAVDWGARALLEASLLNASNMING